MEDTIKKIEKYRKRARSKRTLTAVCIILALLLILAGIAFFAIHAIINNPERFFKESVIQTPDNQAETTPAIEISPRPDDNASVTPNTDDGRDAHITPGIVNIMIFGLDAYESGGTSSGSMPHTDVNMVVAVNFNEKRVDLISLPRDTFTTAPGFRGYYKLNGVFNVGGGMDDIESGLELACRAAEQWLGGISIQYYYALDFQAVVDIVNAIGGIDYDVDQAFTGMNNIEYGTGMHHLDGDAVLRYLRIRKRADGTDRSRTARQRRMMIAIFNKLKAERSLSVIPSLINASSSGIYTNTTLFQTAALANYATNLDSDRIGTHVMDGAIQMNYDWAFSFAHQQERIDLIREIYGIDVLPVGICSVRYERWLHDEGFLAIKYIRQAEKVINFVNESVAAGSVLSTEQSSAYSDCFCAYSDLKAAFDIASKWYEMHYDGKALSYSVEETAERNRLTKDINEAMAALKEKVLALAKASGYNMQSIQWNVQSEWFRDKDINEVYVDFR